MLIKYFLFFVENLRRIFVINGIHFLKLCSAVFQNVKCFIFKINTAPKLFTVIWNLLKPILHKVTVDKVMIFGSDPIETEKWKAALLEEIEADNLPAIYGGKMTDPEGDPRCLHLVFDGLLIYNHHHILFSFKIFIFYVAVEYGWGSAKGVLHEQ